MSDVTQHLAASVICYTARPEGLIQTLSAVAKQAFRQDWELVLVDACWAQRHELVKFLWDCWASTKGHLVHVPPLLPIGRDHYWNQDIPLYQHTGWSYARGNVIVQIEDYMTVHSNWLSYHAAFVAEHPNLVSMGEVRSGAECDFKAPFYFSGPAHDRQRLWLQKFPELKHRVMNPASYGCANLTATEEWLSGNVAFSTHAVLKARCFPEGPTHHPERVNVPVLLNLAGLSIWPTENMPAWHASHGIAVVDRVITSRHGNLCESIPVKHTTASTPLPTDEIKIRDIVAERKRLGRWV